MEGKFKDIEISLKEEDFDVFKTIINLIEKQQKEIEELKKPKYLVHFENNKITKMELINDYISKDKIREFIKKELPDDELMKWNIIYDVDGIDLRKKLEKILEENINE
jgi:hypothetical protein